MLIKQKCLTENFLEISREIKENYSNFDVTFDKTYKAYDESQEWVDPTTTKKVFDEILRNIAYKPDDIFIDCGSGLGHVLYLSSFHFNKVIGIEILETVAQESKKNLLALMGESEYQKKIELIIGDIFKQTHDFFDKGNIFYISSPFSCEDDFRLLIDSISQSINRKNRDVYIIYYYPYFKKVLRDYSNYFKFVKELKLIGNVVIYKH